ncbi:MAG TPA: STAS domain-containing protein [Mycobacteriales bacterium]|nr:STAS domain-containing protein [Mycobacteriales bacterium]
MTVETVRDDVVRVLRASGELDAAVAPPLLDQVGDWVRGARAVVLDLADVAFFDSSGVRLVDRFSRECGRAGASLRVVAPPGGVARQVLEIVGMAGPLVDDDLDAAVAALSA